MGSRYKNTIKNKVILFLFDPIHSLGQWLIKNADIYPCTECIHCDDYGCTRCWTDRECHFEMRKIVK